MPQTAEYAFNGLVRSELTEDHIRSLFYEWLPKTLSDHALTADGVKAFTGRFCAHFNNNLGLKPFGATDAQATAAHLGDPSPYG